ncbi:hypothetical protein A3K63_00045 [Candidatus Micrarchaeota archaeon RBG_16_49_10]|nr:MAG: hypothetical protein A3K63_00045 [Candidatus Micrarchaeota archaeon RBG_16_49_10]
MNLLQGAVLGTIQGILEWLPVSSKGIVTLTSINLFKTPAAEALTFSIWLHVGTLLAALIYFRKDIIALFKNIPEYLKKGRPDSEKSKLTTFLLLSIILTGLVGFPLFLLVLETFSAVPARIATALIGFLLLATGLVQKVSKRGKREMKNLEKKDGIIMGFFQGLAAIPGVSRSGTTVSVLLMRDFSSEAALELSFLASIPAVFFAEIGLGLVKGVELTAASLVGVLFSFLFGILSIKALLVVAKKVKFWKFCIAFGLLTVLAALI